jgi:hypothetical protein
MELADKVDIYDNTSKMKAVLKIDHGKIQFESREMPNQLKAHLYETHRLILKDQKEGREFRTEISVKRFGEKTIEDQKKEAAKEFAKRIGPNSGKLSARFEALSQEQAQQGRDYSLNRGIN